MIEDAVVHSSAVYEDSLIYDYHFPLGKWHRSKDRKEGMNFASYMLNKKWTLEEEFNNHMMRFQQVSNSQLHLVQ